jgi:uncharacterized alpha-E superfamily protein
VAGFEPVVAADLDSAALAALAARIDTDPAAYTLQARVRPSETPCWDGSGLQPRAAVLRVFALADGAGGWRVLPGALTRVAGERGRDPWLSMQHGSASADTWVVASGEVDTSSLLPRPLTALELLGWHRSVTSRAAENLFWLGRYTERAENSARLARTVLEGLPYLDTALLHWLGQQALGQGLVGEGVPSPGAHAQATRVFERALLHALPHSSGEPSVGHSLRALRGCAQALRERLSPEAWRLVLEVDEHFEQHLAAALAQRPFNTADVVGVLNRTAVHLAAITGGQTDRMTRDDGWRLLSVGRQIERLDTQAGLLATGLAAGLQGSDDGFALLLTLFDSLITYRAQFQARRELLPLVQLLVLDTDNPRSLAWVARTLRERLRKLARHDPAWADAQAAALPQPEHWRLEALGTLDAQGQPAELVAALQQAQRSVREVSDAISQRLFAHVGVADQRVWQ